MQLVRQHAFDGLDVDGGDDLGVQLLGGHFARGEVLEWWEIGVSLEPVVRGKDSSPAWRALRGFLQVLGMRFGYVQASQAEGGGQYLESKQLKNGGLNTLRVPSTGKVSPLRPTLFHQEKMLE